MEYIHDELVPSTMSFDEPVDTSAFKDLFLLDSAVNRAFATFDGRDLYETVHSKAAALFHSLTCNHCFYNGNKRTAVIALDLFLSANHVVLLLSNEDIYQLAKDTAAGTENGHTAEQILENIHRHIYSSSASLDVLRTVSSTDIPMIDEICRSVELEANRVRNHPLNSVVAINESRD